MPFGGGGRRGLIRYCLPVQHWLPVKQRAGRPGAAPIRGEPLQLVVYFHKQLGREDKNRFEDKEVDYALKLLKRFTYAEVEELADYAVRHAHKKHFDPLYFNILCKYVERWQEQRIRKAAKKVFENKIASCSLCDNAGYIILQDPENHTRSYAYECPHNPSELKRIEEDKGMKRI